MTYSPSWFRGLWCGIRFIISCVSLWSVSGTPNAFNNAAAILISSNRWLAATLKFWDRSYRNWFFNLPIMVSTTQRHMVTFLESLACCVVSWYSLSFLDEGIYARYPHDSTSSMQSLNPLSNISTSSLWKNQWNGIRIARNGFDGLCAARLPVRATPLAHR